MVEKVLYFASLLFKAHVCACVDGKTHENTALSCPENNAIIVIITWTKLCNSVAIVVVTVQSCNKYD